MTQTSTRAARRIFWIGASLVAAVIMVFFGVGRGLFKNPDTRVFEVSVFFAAWVTIVLLIRVFARRFKGIEDLTLERLVSEKDEDPPAG